MALYFSVLWFLLAETLGAFDKFRPLRGVVLRIAMSCAQPPELISELFIVADLALAAFSCSRSLHL